MPINKPTSDFIATTFDVALAQGETGAITAKIGTGLSIPATNSFLQIDYNSTVALGSANAPETIFYATYNSGTGALTGVVRGQAGTTDVAHDAGAEVQCAMSTAFLEDNTGWKEIKGTFTYASATTINVPSGAASIYSVGDKLRFQNNDSGTWLYFYIVTVADTLLTVTGGSDYAVPNATLTDNYYSKSSSPVGFPQWFAYTTTRAVSGGTAPTYGTSISKFRISSRTVEVKWFWRNTTGNQAGEGANSLTATIPVTGVFKDSAYASGLECLGLGHSYENGGTIGLVSIVPLSATTVGMALSDTTTIKGNDQSADARVISASFSYEI